MKEVLVQIDNGYAAWLKDDGTVVRRKDKGHAIGYVINDTRVRSRSFSRVYVAAAAAALVLCLFGAGVWAYVTPYYYVSIDVNPGLVMTINRFERVIGLDAVNEDAEELLAKLHLEHENAQDALVRLVDEMEKDGYFDGERAGLLIATAAQNRNLSEEKVIRLTERIREQNQERDRELDVQGEAVGYDLVQMAKEYGMTPGRLNIGIRLLNMDIEDPDAMETLKDTPMRDLMHPEGNDQPGSVVAENRRSDQANEALETRPTKGGDDEDDREEDRIPPGLLDKDGIPPGLADKEDKPKPTNSNRG